MVAVRVTEKVDSSEQNLVDCSVYKMVEKKVAETVE
jgi:hypothetical protein